MKCIDILKKKDMFVDHMIHIYKFEKIKRKRKKLLKQKHGINFETVCAKQRYVKRKTNKQQKNKILNISLIDDL